MLYQTDSGADHLSPKPSCCQQINQLRGLPERELCRDPGEMSEELGGVLGGFSTPCKEFREVKGCFCTHHKQLSQTGRVDPVVACGLLNCLYLTQQGWQEAE